MSNTSLRDRLTRALGDEYAIDAEIGAGMSRVYAATELGLGRRVVIKVLPPELAGEISHDRFRREIQLVATLQHPHIVPLLVAGEADGLPYFTMPFVEGETLRQRLQRGPLDLREAFQVFRDVLKALAWAHAHGVVHRDVKPENVMLSGGVAVVTDFGVAKALEAAQHPQYASGRMSMGLSVGTPQYMAPEQAAADPSADHRADLYAIGMVAYEALCGAHPFEGKRGMALMTAHATETPPPLKPRVPHVPSAICNVIMQAMAKRAEERPPSADAVLAVLDGLSTPRPSTALSMEVSGASVASAASAARNGPRGTRDTIRLPRRATVAGLIAGGMLLLLALFAVLATRR
ncbi:MAG: serine/threonine protein kinase [Gemmatimonadaceae bacterium]|jgi:serine/threonine-protein kinase|nr:serine/threonine protein kinase [Gemmatimonadaceae bacterium]